jgi:hypothetical protein
MRKKKWTCGGKGRKEEYPVVPRGTERDYSLWDMINI